MMLYVLIGLALSLAGVAGLQFFYMIYLERLDREQKNRIRELEYHCVHLNRRLAEAESKIAEQNELLEIVSDEAVEEVWAEYINE